MKHIISYLEKLSKNNNREWFHEHKAEYDLLKKDFKNIVQGIIFKTAEFDESVRYVEPDKCIFRIQRDIRFSKNKTPYKTNLSAAISPTGRKGDVAFYYFQVGSKKEECFIGGGIWMPEKETLDQTRRYISNHYEELEDILYTREFAEMFGELESDSKLTRPPRGFDENHPAIEFLKLKSFTVGTNIADIVNENDFEDRVASIFKQMSPFVFFMRKAIKQS
jgi:uncharacterized protein (TIGR02453 family)